MRSNRLLLLLLLVMAGSPALLHAQTDSAGSRLLSEVVVKSDRDRQQFDFHRSSKLAGTEEIMSRMDGVNLIRRGAYGMEPVLRVYSGNQIALTIDGTRVYGACTDRMDPATSYVEPFNLDEISASHGAHGNMQGSSIGGNINLRFKAPEVACHSQWNTQVHQSWQSNNNALATGVVISKQGIRQGFRISLTYRNAGDYNCPDSLIKHSAYEKLNFSVAWKYAIDSLRSVQVNYLGDLAKNMGYPALPMDVGKADAHLFTLKYLRTYRHKLFRNSQTAVYANDIYHSMDDTHRENVPMHMDMPGYSRTYGAYAEVSLGYHRHSCLVRLDGHQNKIKAEMTMYPRSGGSSMYMETLPESLLKNLGMAIRHTWMATDHYSIQGNVRLDYYQQMAIDGPGALQWDFMQDIRKPLEDHLKSISLMQQVQWNNKLTAQLTLGFAERLPSSNERFGFYLFNPSDNYDYLGNPALKKECALQVEVRISRDARLFSWSIQPFVHRLSNYIYPFIQDSTHQMTIGAFGLKSYRNIDAAWVAGYESNFQLRLNESTQYRTSLRYLYTRTFEGMPLPLTTPFKVLQVLRGKVWNIQWQFEHQYAASQNRVNSDFRERTTPSFHLFNARISKTIPLKQQYVQIAIACENISNRWYFEHTDIGYVPRMGRNLMFSLSWIN